MKNCSKETTIFGKSAENPEVQLKNSKYQSKEALAGVLLLLIVLPESLIYSGEIKIALLLYTGILVALSLISIFIKEQEIRNICQVFLLLPIFRLINFSVPMFPESSLLSFEYIYAPMIIPLAIVTIRQQFTYEQLGLSFKKIWYYLPVSIIIGLLLGQGESFITQTVSLIPDLSFINILKLTVVMVFFVGITEELLFRSILQTRLEGIFGSRGGLVLSSLVFGLMNSGLGSPYEILYASFTGFLIGYLFYRTRSLPFIALIHGFINVFSFGVIPLMGHGLGIL
ncbi:MULTISPECIES: CPBP family intramembrane glutamic endopeptidase [unclassified Methanosarcina]|uniref:CPBP family intramembrane glutamic endopeptidase n=1 Tax=unclassified Methanosarcina TaxID=2644672 RepID=UPI00061592D2|nr:MULTISPECIES: CPBP family intramembrane glutamic endopeptidase [unclassified Methanosarcina]AKB17626.1 CAAX amino terminal protease family protein [Methanosarcina sp. WWM596]AKB20994.1 CAAX amino terminal protease family protein [Methanosarcina sp. WH1]